MKLGYSRQVILDNAKSLELQGWPRRFALREAEAKARLSYWRKYPGGWLPMRLQLPKGLGNRYNYDEKGFPIGNKNTQMPITDVIQNSKETSPLKEAFRLQNEFSGSNSMKIERVKIPELPSTLVALGPLSMLGYVCVEDGIEKEYLHRFSKRSRPLLAAGHDGKTLWILRGEFIVNQRGIVDVNRDEKGFSK